ncbi:MAG: MFS transporter [Candidatus Omnitrophica bacterium]|nr:MFS transporter [Candidatus Omnitrophota bacterium]
MDRWIIFSCAGLRALAISLSSIILTLYLSSLDFPPGQIAVVISLGLAGCALGTLLASFCADHFGRQRTVALVGLLMALGGVVLAFVHQHMMIYLAAFIGMLNGMGRDRGMGLTVEQAIIPQITDDKNRTQTFAWYNVSMDVCNAAGALLAFLPAFLRSHWFVSTPVSYQWTWGLYSLLSLAAAVLALGLSPAVEAKTTSPVGYLSPESKGKVFRFAALSSLDSLGGGFLTNALISFWFFKRFGVDESFLAPLFFFARIANSFSHLAAAWLAKRIGLINTMVFTHLPSSLLLMTVPFMPTLWIASVLFIIRECLVEMDVPTRQSYIVAIVKEGERTVAAGITNLTRSTAWAVSPMIAAPLMGSLTLSAPLFIGPALKVTYDICLYYSFRHIKPPEELKK